MKMILLILAILLSAVACEPQPENSGVSLHAELGGTAEGFERACGKREFNFPADHSAHPEFRNEWWYITGNLENTDGKRFGFHITFFRIANHPPVEEVNNSQSSNWESNEFYMVHLAVSEADGEIKTYERFSRAAVDLAGAERQADNTVRIWLDEWQLIAKPDQHQQPVWHLQAGEADTHIDLQLSPTKPLVLQGEDGYSQKSEDPCNASYYYSFTRMNVTGSLHTGNTTHQVNGSGWLDREWSSSALGADQSGWDWFALQLNDGRDIMLYQLRRNDGSRDDFSHAVEIDQNGNTNEISIENINIKITRWWQSDTGNRYPVAGVIHRTDTDETLNFTPLIDNQLLDLTVRYWEGAITLTDQENNPVGRGYMELTGY